MNQDARNRGVSASLTGLERVKAEIKKRSWNREDLAQAAGLNISTIKRFFGLDNVDKTSVEVIANVLELQPIEIVDPNHWYKRTPAEPKLDAEATLYVERPPIEAKSYRELLKPGALIRIKAPQKMGKTWLMERVLAQVNQQKNYCTVILSFELADNEVFSDLERFAKWFCTAVSDELELPDQLDRYWKSIRSYNLNTKDYFQKYLLAQIPGTLILVLDNTDRVFEHANVATDFCRLLRSWHELARRGEDSWRKLRLVIVHATEVYSSLDINHSPLAGVGVDFELPEFNVEQVQELAQRYGLSWDEAEAGRLINLVGGHPYLVHLALDRIKSWDSSLERILQEAHTEAGIYGNHLRQLLSTLQQAPELIDLFREVVMAEQPIQLNSVPAFKLDSIGLVKLLPFLGGNKAKPRCRLYREYFLNYFSINDSHN
jgi:lambda repressor-like predicted transcriptional regulator